MIVRPHPSVSRGPARAWPAVILLLASAAAQAFNLPNPLNLFGGGEAFVVWQDAGQYVKIVDQDKFERYKHAPRNRQPASPGANDLAIALASLQVRGGDGTKGGGALFTNAEVALLAPKLADTFTRLKDDQDVIFAVSDANAKAGARVSTAGRMFINDSGLNLILGDSLQPAAAAPGVEVDHGEPPYRPGRRRESLDTAAAIAGGPGIGFTSGWRRPRYDWVVIDLPAVVAAWRGPKITLPVAPAAPAAAGDAGAAPEDTAKLLQERQQMREEMARMRQQLDAKNAADAAPAAAAPAIPPGARSPDAEPPAKAAAGGGTIEQRLATLQSLHDKKLITDEEYAAKRKKLLEEL